MQTKLGWIALDPREVVEAARRRNLDARSGSVDELGLGAVLEDISRHLFPAFTTAMTRARYFMFARGVFDLAAELSRKELHRTGKWQEEINEVFYRLFRKQAEHYLADIEQALCFSLCVKTPVRNGTIGRQRIQRSALKIRKAKRDGTLTLPGVKRDPNLQRSPSLIFLSGLKKLDAFGKGVNGPADLWRQYLKFHLDSTDVDAKIWNDEWRRQSTSAANVVRNAYEKYERARRMKKIVSWADDVKKRCPALTLKLSKPEAKLLWQRLKSVESPVMKAFGDRSNVPGASSTGFQALARRTTDRRAKELFLRAARALAVIAPALAIYDALSKNPGADTSTMVERARRKKVLAGVRLLLDTKEDPKWASGAYAALQWLSDWLSAAGNGTKSVELVDRIVDRAEAISRERNKRPTVRRRTAGNCRYRSAKKSKRYENDDLPPSKAVPRGRLYRSHGLISEINEARLGHKFAWHR
jgi:hypothetical protein